MSNKVFDNIKALIDSDDIVLFMKGSASSPMCGFSSSVVQILNKMSLKFTAVNVLEDENIRQSIKTFSDWPTIPQLYIRGEFVGGSDIVREMYQSGELSEIFKKYGIVPGPQ